jgi:hypothetical protein
VPIVFQKLRHSLFESKKQGISQTLIFFTHDLFGNHSFDLGQFTGRAGFCRGGYLKCGSNLADARAFLNFVRGDADDGQEARRQPAPESAGDAMNRYKTIPPTT